MKTSKSERRIDRTVKLIGFGAVACAMFAAVGIAHGIHDQNPAGGWMLPIGAGIIAAIAFAIFWHAVTKHVVGFVRPAILVGMFASAVVVTAVALGASAQAIATAIAGRGALSAVLSEQVDGYNAALSEAYADAIAWRGIADSALVIATGFDMKAQNEASGTHGTGKGQGKNWSQYNEFASGFRNIGTSLNELLDSAKDLQTKGQRAMDQMRDTAARGDQTAFLSATGTVATVVDELNAIDPKSIIMSGGVVNLDPKGGVDLSSETADFRAKAEKALAERETVQVPTFRPISLGEATRKQVFDAASHAWILAGAIDVLPLLFFFVAFLMSREVWMNESVTSEALTPEGRDAVDRQKVKSLRGLGLVRDAAE